MHRVVLVGLLLRLLTMMMVLFHPSVMLLRGGEGSVITLGMVALWDGLEG